MSTTRKAFNFFVLLLLFRTWIALFESFTGTYVCVTDDLLFLHHFNLKFKKKKEHNFSYISSLKESKYLYGGIWLKDIMIVDFVRIVTPCDLYCFTQLITVYACVHDFRGWCQLWRVKMFSCNNPSNVVIRTTRNGATMCYRLRTKWKSNLMIHILHIMYSVRVGWFKIKIILRYIVMRPYNDVHTKKVTTSKKVRAWDKCFS